MMHSLISEFVPKTESMRTFSDSPVQTLTVMETSSKRSGSTTTSKVLKRYLTSGTHEGSSSEYKSESITNFSLKTHSVVYEDSSFILKKIQSMGKRMTAYGPNFIQSDKNLSTFLKNKSMIDSSSQASSSPGSFARPLDRTSSKNRMILENEQFRKNEPIREEPMEDDEEFVSI
jgi:hypothetical protein